MEQSILLKRVSHLASAGPGASSFGRKSRGLPQPRDCDRIGYAHTLGSRGDGARGYAKLGAGRQLSVVNQIWGSPWTPARCMTFRRASDETKALATSAVSKSCHTVTSFGSSSN
jgi:hypothetical protein